MVLPSLIHPVWLLLKHRQVLACISVGLLVLAPACLSAEKTERCHLADGFDYPVGKPNAKGYYKARGFTPKGHLGEDWDGVGGGDTDLGDPVYAIARGVVVYSEHLKAGWGNVIIVRHVYKETDGRIAMVDSLYGHVLERRVKVGDQVERGQRIASIGTADGIYPAHLHLEIRKNLLIGMNRTKFAQDYSNYYSPTAFIVAHRSCPTAFWKYDVPVDTFAPFGQTLTVAQVKRGKTLNFTVVNGPGAVTAKPSEGNPEIKGVTQTTNGNRKVLSIPVGPDNTGTKPPTKTSPALSQTVSTKPTPTTKNKPPVETASNTKTKSPPSSTEPAPPPSPPAAEEEPKKDFWTRLRAKLTGGHFNNRDDNRP